MAWSGSTVLHVLRATTATGSIAGTYCLALRAAPGGGTVHPTHGPLPMNHRGIEGESVGGLVGSSTGGLGDWWKLKSLMMLPRMRWFSRTSGRGSHRPSVDGSR